MSDHILQQFQQSAEEALKSNTVQEGLSHLTHAFSLFSEETHRLKSAHIKLQERFNAVNQELADQIQQLRSMHEQMQLILRGIANGILLIRLNGQIAICNEAACKLLNVQSEEIIGQKVWEVFKDDQFGFSIKEALTFGITYKHIYRSDFEISTSFIYEGKQSDHGMLINLLSLKEKQELKHLTQRNDQMLELGKMAATVAHEIRNPLGGIRGYASLLYRDLEGNEHLQEMASFIIDGTKGLEKIVSSILHYAKPVQIEPFTQDLGAFLKKLCKFVKVDPAFPKNITFSTHIPNSPILVPFDERALKSALLNLIFNAFQAMPDGGELTLSLLKHESICQITITDTGIGISENQLDLLFSPFYTTKKRGNGLGLVETQKLIKAHYGTIEPRSKLGVGTTFTINLPLRR